MFLALDVLRMLSISKVGTISSGNQPLRVNYGVNLNHTILIQGRTHESWEGWFAKFMEVGGMICKCAFANYSSQLL
jgi:hypothetical protein